LITTQPLHGFSQKYFQQLPGLYSYLGGETPREEDSRKTVTLVKENKLFDWDEIAPGALLSFFRNPFKWYYNKVLGIYYREEEVLLPDTELFELDGLQKWALKNDLLRLEDEAVEVYHARALNTGALPLKNMSTITIAETMEVVTPVKKLLKTCVGDSTEAEVMIDISLGRFSNNRAVKRSVR
jgi:exodeoxyribonuclease V gamma subunit